MWAKLILFWDAELWNFRLDEIRGWRKRWYQSLRILSLSLSGFYRDNCTLRASSLTYYSIMSIVPVLALAFSIARGFDLQEPLKVQLLDNFHDHKDALTEIILFANRLIEETKGGVLAGIGIAVLLWSGISLIGSMEAAMNHIWNVDQMRSWRRILSEYLALLLIAPILFVVASSTVVLIASYLEHLFKLVPGASFFLSFFHFSIQLVPYVLFWLFFTFLYYFLPNTKVKMTSALLGGVI
jgi:membrane protein